MIKVPYQPHETRAVSRDTTDPTPHEFAGSSFAVDRPDIDGQAGLPKGTHEGGAYPRRITNVDTVETCLSDRIERLIHGNTVGEGESVDGSQHGEPQRRGCRVPILESRHGLEVEPDDGNLIDPQVGASNCLLDALYDWPTDLRFDEDSAVWWNGGEHLIECRNGFTHERWIPP